MKSRGQFLGGRVLRAEEQKASEGHKAWEASQVHIPNTLRLQKNEGKWIAFRAKVPPGLGQRSKPVRLSRI